MDAQRIVQHPRHRRARVERGERVLEHHLHAGAAGAQGRAAQRQKILALEMDFACIRLYQPQEKARDGGFAASRGAGQRQRLAGFDGKADIVDRRDGAAAATEAFRQAGYCKYLLTH